MVKAGFFIVGAPKCGTTSMHRYLRGHPEIYLPYLKDAGYFNTDLPRDYQKDDYNSLYTKEKVGGAKIAGETCVWYLYSKEAAKRIFNFNPKAKIIIMLRNPINAIESFHNQKLFGLGETEKDISKALKLESRRKTEYKKTRNKDLKTLFYTDIYDYYPQVKRYTKLFDKNRIKIILLKDFSKKTESVFRETLDFLEVDNQYKPSFKRRNVRKKIRFKKLHKFINNPNNTLAKTGRKIIKNKHIRMLLYRTAVKLNKQATNKTGLPLKLKKQLIKKLVPNIKKLEKLIDRDLESWVTIK